MRVAVISDIHANADALAVVRSALREQEVDRIVSLGDVVGYNACPRETIALLREMDVAGVGGNHDLMVLGRLPAVCGPRGLRAVAWTAGNLSREDRAYLEALPGELELPGGVLCVHSTLGDTVVRLRTPEQFLAQRQLIHERYPDARVCFTGHTHEPDATEITADGVVRDHPSTQIVLDPGSFYFINPGSVGEPRGYDDRATWTVFDDVTRLISFHRAAYDRTHVLEVNERRGLPASRVATTTLASRFRALVRLVGSRVLS